MQLFITTAKGLEELLAEEVRQLGISEIKLSHLGIYVEASIEQVYSLIMWSRLANRILMLLDTFEQITDRNALYQAMSSIEWDSHFTLEYSFSIHFTGTNQLLKNSQFSAQVCKDAVCDQFVERYQNRPFVDKNYSDVVINCHLRKEKLQVYLDLTGQSLHRRGYRQQQGEAPLKENLAAAIVLRSGWGRTVSYEQPFVDVMCGSGTLLIEAAMIAADMAPGIFKSEPGCIEFLSCHQSELWQKVVDDAQQRATQGKRQLHHHFYGFDKDHKVLHKARENAEAAGLADFIQFLSHDIYANKLPVALPDTQGIVVSNPPYGERIGDELTELYIQISQTLRRDFKGWAVALISSDASLLSAMQLRHDKQYKLMNGALECVLNLYQVNEDAQPLVVLPPIEDIAMPESFSNAADDFRNRIKKNMKECKKTLKTVNTNCYRLYDADIPEYALAIDVYDTHLHVQEYQAPKSIPVKKAERRLREALYLLHEVTGVAKNKIHIKLRKRQKGLDQYEKNSSEFNYIQVYENNAAFWVNLNDYLDTGLFLDHRDVRKSIQEMAKGARFLNLFAYTGTASVHAALGGATAVTTVDMSKTYLKWAKSNFELNKLKSPEYQFIQADCLQWLDDMRGKSQFDIIFLDPPTFSNSKRMEDVFDVQRDHVKLILKAARLLADDGVLIFSNNFRKFKLEQEKLKYLECEDITAQTIPFDFKRNAKIHNCWIIHKKQ